MSFLSHKIFLERLLSNQDSERAGRLLALLVNERDFEIDHSLGRGFIKLVTASWPRPRRRLCDPVQASPKKNVALGAIITTVLIQTLSQKESLLLNSGCLVIKIILDN